MSVLAIFAFIAQNIWPVLAGVFMLAWGVSLAVVKRSGAKQQAAKQEAADSKAAATVVTTRQTVAAQSDAELDALRQKWTAK